MSAGGGAVRLGLLGSGGGCSWGAGLRKGKTDVAMCAGCGLSAVPGCGGCRMIRAERLVAVLGLPACLPAWVVGVVCVVTC